MCNQNHITFRKVGEKATRKESAQKVYLADRKKQRKILSLRGKLKWEGKLDLADRKKQRKILSLRGKLKWEGKLDEMRESC